MSVKLQKIPLVPWHFRTSGSLVLLPNDDVLVLKSQLGDMDLAGIVPPYSDDWSMNATAAAMVRGAFLKHRILAPIPGASLSEIAKYLQTFAAAGFDAFIMPEAPQGSPVQHRAGHWAKSGLLRDSHWYHVAGGRGVDIPADVPGRWTWSVQGM